MSLKFKGFAELKDKLEALGKSRAKVVMRRAIRAGTTVILASVKSEIKGGGGVTKDSRGRFRKGGGKYARLKKSMTAKVTNKGFNFAGIVGADVAKLKAFNADDPNYPTNIDHLIEYGHTTPAGTVVPPKGFLRRGWDNAQGAADDKTLSTLKAGIESEAAG